MSQLPDVSQLTGLVVVSWGGEESQLTDVSQQTDLILNSWMVKEENCYKWSTYGVGRWVRARERAKRMVYVYSCSWLKARERARPIAYMSYVAAVGSTSERKQHLSRTCTLISHLAASGSNRETSYVASMGI